MRFVPIALLIAFAPATALSQGAGQEIATTARQLQSSWRSCVNEAINLGAAQLRDFVGPAENVFQACATEEQLFLAYVNGAAGGAAGTILISHYRDKVTLKKRLTDDYFKAMVKDLGKQ